MSLIRYTDWLNGTGTKNLSVPHQGVVKDNNDPKKIGRCKVWIPGLLEVATEDLPWFYPKKSTFLGSSSGSSNTAIPEIGSNVTVTFPFGSIYSGFYSGAWETEKTHVSEFDQDYPNAYGTKDSAGNITRVNKATNAYDFIHSSGTTIHIDQDGSITITGKKDVTINVQGDVKATVTGDLSANVTGNGEVICTGNLTLQGGMVMINS